MGRTNLEHVIINNLINRPDFAQRVLPFIESNHFKSREDRAIFAAIQSFYDEYNAAPSFDAIGIQLEHDQGLDDDTYAKSVQLLEVIEGTREKQNEDWLFTETEKWVRNRAIEIALLDSIEIVQGTDKELTRDAIPEIMSKALSISFDPSIGLDFRQDYAGRFQRYKSEFAERIQLDIGLLNDITDGGFPKQCVHVFMGQTNVGKTLCLCSLSAGLLTLGKKVLYISAEVSDLHVSQRIEANLAQVNLSDFNTMSEVEYLRRMQRVDDALTGQLIIKQYPTASASVSNFRALLNDLKLKKNFVPDVIMVDYINLFRSARVKSDNTYLMIKNVAEELRGLAVEFNQCVFTATQVDRQGLDATSLSLKNVPESKALSDTVDFLGGLLCPPTMRHENTIMVQPLKGRFFDVTKAEPFLLGINRGQQRIFELDDAPRLVSINDLDETASDHSEKKSISMLKQRMGGSIHVG
jgi:replicative DNA helicase